MKFPNAVAVIAFAACVVLLVLFLRSREEMAVARAQVAALKAANEELSLRVANLEGAAIDKNILKRLEADQRDAMKLRAEVATLKKAVATAENSAAAARERLAPSLESVASKQADSSTNPYTRVFGRKLTANVGIGHALVFGGWQSQPGKQTFALAIPSHDPADRDAVTVKTKWLEISDEALKSLDATMLVRAAGQQATMTPEQLAEFLKVLETTPGVSILGSPSVMVSSGRQARVSMGDMRPTPDGAMVEFGSAMDFTPTLSADGTTVDFVMDAKQTLPLAEPTASKE